METVECGHEEAKRCRHPECIAYRSTRFVGIRMENGVETTCTYGYAMNARKKIEQVYARVQCQRTVSQEWTGKIYRTSKQAAEDSWRLNSRAEVQP